MLPGEVDLFGNLMSGVLLLSLLPNVFLRCTVLMFGFFSATGLRFNRTNICDLQD